MSVLLGVAHGSKAPGPQQVVEELLARAAAQRPGLVTAAAYVDNASPSVRAALEQLNASGIDDVVVLPLLLTPASHSKSDLPGSVQAGRVAHPGMRLRYGRPFGPHPVLVDLLAQRLREAGAADADPVVLVAGGALDPDANAQVAATARLLLEGRGFPSVDVAFTSATRPTVVEALERLRREGHAQVSLARYFLGDGFLPTLAARKAAEVEGLSVVVAEPLGVSDALAGLVLERYDEALLGDVRMNCDACMHRIALPGHEAAVGAPQEPHTHPDDE